MIIKIEWVEKEFQQVNAEGKTEVFNDFVPTPSVQRSEEDEPVALITLGQLNIAMNVVRAEPKLLNIPKVTTNDKGEEVPVARVIEIIIDNDTLDAVIKSNLSRIEILEYLQNTVEATKTSDLARAITFGLMSIRSDFYIKQVIPAIKAGVGEVITNALHGRVPVNKTRGGLIVPK